MRREGGASEHERRLPVTNVQALADAGVHRGGRDHAAGDVAVKEAGRAAKAGVISITKSLAAQLVGEDIRVNCIIPGYVAQSPAQTDDEVSMRKQRGRFITVRRLGEAWELGALAVFLCSDASSYITGESFPIDGGGLAGGIAPTGFAMAETVEASRG